MPEKDKKLEDRVIGAVERIAGAADRYGIPALTFAVGTMALLWPATKVTDVVADILPWLGCVLILAALATYIWQTARSTSRVHTTPPAVPTEFKDFLDQIWRKIEEHDEWQKQIIEKMFDAKSKSYEKDNRKDQ